MEGYNIGEFDTKIEILKCILTKGDKGQKGYSFEHHSDVWAKVIHNVDEMVDNGNLQASDAIEVVCYKIPGLNARWKVNIDGVGYAIIGIDPISRICPVNRITLKMIE